MNKSKRNEEAISFLRKDGFKLKHYNYSFLNDIFIFLN